jgi:hypothetical protein
VSFRDVSRGTWHRHSPHFPLVGLGLNLRRAWTRIRDEGHLIL